MTDTFDGETFDHKHDAARLSVQLDKVRSMMLGGGWHTLDAIADEVKAPPASVSARLRDLRKSRFGAYNIERRGVPGKRGLYEYHLGAHTAPVAEYAHGKTRSETAGC